MAQFGIMTNSDIYWRVYRYSDVELPLGTLILYAKLLQWLRRRELLSLSYPVSWHEEPISLYTEQSIP